MKQTTPAIHVFYSYKGGVGRTTLLVNSAVLLAQRGFRVLVVDGDIEAPGACYFKPFRQALKKADSSQDKLGFVDTIGRLSKVMNDEYDLDEEMLDELVENTTNALKDSVIQVESAHWNREDRGKDGQLGFIPAGKPGQKNDDYARAVSKLNLDNIYKSGRSELLAKHLSRVLVDTAKNLDYEVILMDSRTGLSQSGGFLVNDLADYLTIVTSLNTQGLRGSLVAAGSVKYSWLKKGKAGTLHLAVSMVPTQSDGSYHVLSNEPDKKFITPEALAQSLHDNCSFGYAQQNRDNPGGTMSAAQVEILYAMKLFAELQKGLDVFLFPYETELSCGEPVFVNEKSSRNILPLRKLTDHLVDDIKEQKKALVRELVNAPEDQREQMKKSTEHIEASEWLAREEPAVLAHMLTQRLSEMAPRSLLGKRFIKRSPAGLAYEHLLNSNEILLTLTHLCSVVMSLDKHQKKQGGLINFCINGLESGTRVSVGSDSLGEADVDNPATVTVWLIAKVAPLIKRNVNDPVIHDAIQSTDFYKDVKNTCNLVIKLSKALHDKALHDEVPAWARLAIPFLESIQSDLPKDFHTDD